MSDNLRWFTKAVYGFDHVVRLAPDGGWDRGSPCEGWTARHVMGHVIAVQRYLESCVLGVEPPMHPMVDPDRHAGDDPAATWASTRDAVLDVLDHPGALTKRITSYRGEERTDELIGFNVVDTTVHSWDLARALGVDDRLDPGLVVRATEIIAPVADAMRGATVFGPAAAVGADADAQTRLLALCGRTS